MPDPVPASSAPRAQVVLDLLGVFRLTIDGDAKDGLARKARALLAYLAMTPGHCATRDRLADLLWGDRFDEQARQSLRQTLTGLRRLLDAGAPDLLVTDRDNVALSRGAFVTDIELFERATATGDLVGMTRAAEVWRADFLEGLEIGSPAWEEWLASTRRAWRRQGIGLLARLARTAIDAGDRARALAAAERLAELDPLDERLHCLVLEAVARFRGRPAAIEIHRRFAARLETDLGIAPSAETSAFASRLATFAGAPLPSPPPSLLPTLPPPLSLPGEAMAGRRRPEQGKEQVSWRQAVPLGLAAVLFAMAAILAVAPAPQVEGLRGDVASASPQPRVSFHAGHLQAANDESALLDDLKTRLASLPAVAFDAAGRAEFRVDGAVRREDGALVLNLRLIEGATGRAMWAGTLRATVSSERGTLAADAAARLYIEALEAMQRRRGPRAGNESVHRDVKAGWDALKGGATREKVVEAMARFRTALDAEPGSAEAAIGLAHAHVLKLLNRWSTDRDADALAAHTLLDRAIVLAPKSQVALFTMGLLHKVSRDYPRALAVWRVVLILNPEHASSHAQIAHVGMLMGDAAAGAEHSELALALAPEARSIDRTYFYSGMAHVLLGRFDTAEARLASAIRVNPDQPDIYAWRAAALGQLGRVEEARGMLAELRRRWPGWTLDHHFVQAFDRPAMERFSAGLRMAGVEHDG